LHAWAAEMHRVRPEGETSAAIRSVDETPMAHLAASYVTRLRILSLFAYHHQHSRAGDEGRPIYKCYYRGRKRKLERKQIAIVYYSKIYKRNVLN